MAVEQTDVQAELHHLLRSVAEQDEAALSILYEKTSAKLFGVLVRILGHESIAEEALQEVFFRIWTKAGEYQSELGKPLTWMTSIARYHAFDLLRKQKVREAGEVVWKDEQLAKGFQYDNVEDLLEHRDVLKKCLGQLDAQTRECIVAAYVGGYSHKELSKTKATPLGTVKSWIRRGLLALKECFHEHS